jgi:tRNA threonylcarbamoyladenosine modification (KEOPS) complex  Pcc1 subunit
MAGRAAIPNTPIEFFLEALYAGVLGGSAVALLFLVADLVDGRPFFTPSLLGSVIFHGASAEDVAKVHLDAVAYFSIVHVAAFAALGGAISLLVHEVELYSRHPMVVLLVLFVVIEAAFFVVAPVAMPGVIARLGMARVAAANLLAAGTMALFFMLSHRAGTWKQVKRTTPDLILDSLYSGVLGGSAVGAFFLVVDLLDGQPLFTPSLMGSVLFLGVAAEDVTQVHLAAVAYFSLVHIAAFAALGAVVSFVVSEVELHSRHPIEVLLVLFAIIEVAFFALAPMAMPGVIARLGIVRVGIANLLAAGSMSLFFVLYHRSAARETIKHNLADFLFDAFYAGAIGGSTVALFFLAADLLDGQPLFTPSLMGSVLFLGISAEDVTKVHLGAVAYFSLVHFAACLGVGTLVTSLVHEIELYSRHPVAVLVVLFAIIEVVFLLVVSLEMPGVIARLGIVRVGIANLLAAGSMSFFFVLSSDEQAWQKIKHAARLA